MFLDLQLGVREAVIAGLQGRMSHCHVLTGLTVLGVAHLVTGWRNLKLTIFLSPVLGIKKTWCSEQTFRRALAYFHGPKSPNLSSGAFLLGHRISFSSGS